MASPIETKLFDALLANSSGRVCFTYGDKCYGHDDDVVYATIAKNVAIADYRVDILVSFDCDFSLAIECDGHDYHDRTKQQAAYDRSRDRELLVRNVFTIRFTGSEIVHSVERCASDAIRAIHKVNEICHLSMEGWQSGYSHGFSAANVTTAKKGQ